VCGGFFCCGDFVACVSSCGSCGSCVGVFSCLM